jgi:Reverse transcriptase (RNA-dependent DNA polymerase)
MVAGRHMLDAPEVSTYASVISRETVHIALTLAALNDLEVKSNDIQNAYLCAPCEENVYTVLGPEFGEHQGKKALIVRALYGLKSAGASFSRHLANCMRHLGYTRCKADPDLWMKAATRPEDDFQYYAYILLYIDDVLCISHDSVGEIRKLDKFSP